MKLLKTAVAILAAVALSACASLSTTTVPTVKAQQVVDLAISVEKASLRAENIYLAQRPCGLAGSPPPPLCASYAVGVKWKSLDGAVKARRIAVQSAVNTLGTDPKVLDAAVAALQLATNELQNFMAANGAK